MEATLLRLVVLYHIRDTQGCDVLFQLQKKRDRGVNPEAGRSRERVGEEGNQALAGKSRVE